MWSERELAPGFGPASASDQAHGDFIFTKFRKQNVDEHLLPGVMSGQVVKTFEDGAPKVDSPENRNLLFPINSFDLPYPKQSIMGRRSSYKQLASTSRNTMDCRHSSIQSQISHLKVKQKKLDKMETTSCISDFGEKNEDKLLSLMMDAERKAKNKNVVITQEDYTSPTMQTMRVRVCTDGKPFTGESIIWCEVENLSPCDEALPTRQAGDCTEPLLPLEVEE